MKFKQYLTLSMPAPWRRALSLCALELAETPATIDDLDGWVSERLPAWRSRHPFIGGSGRWMPALMGLVLSLMAVFPDRNFAAEIAVDMFGALGWHKRLTAAQRFHHAWAKIVPPPLSSDHVAVVQDSFFRLFDVLVACDLVDPIATESRPRISRPPDLKPVLKRQHRKPKATAIQTPKQRRTVANRIKRLKGSAARWKNRTRWALAHPLPGSVGTGKRQ